LSVDSTNNDAADCYHIVSERTHFRLERYNQIASAQRGTANLAIAVSQRYDAIALLNREGNSLPEQSECRYGSDQTRRTITREPSPASPH